MQFISSKDNRIVKEAASLSEKKYRDSLGLFLIEGPTQLREAYEQGGRPRFIFIRAGADFGEEFEAFGPAVYEVSGDVFEKLAQTENSQGVVAVMEKRRWSEDEFFSQQGSCVVVLDRIQDPGNMGTLLRTAEAMGFAGAILIKGCTDEWAPKVVRSSAGSLMRFPVLHADSAGSAAEMLKAHGKQLYFTAMDAPQSCCEADLAENAAIVIGNEGAGVSEAVKAAASGISIPMAGVTESLNAALAGGIVMYESLRQKLQKQA